MAVQFRRLSRRGAASPPPPVGGVLHVVGASVNYEGHPTIPDGTLQQNVAYYESQLQSALGVSGLQLAGPHGYSGTSWPATFASSSVSWAPGVGYLYSFLNVKTGGFASWAGVRDGNWDAHCTTFVNSVPDGHTCVFAVNHEGENDKGAGYGGPVDDGGVWEAQYAPIHAQGIGRLANIVATLNRPNVWLAWVPMGATFPASGQVGDLGIKGRDPQKWQPYQYMTQAARERTIFACDMYTQMTTAGGAHEDFGVKFGRIQAYSTDAGFGATQFGLFEHTWNNDIGASDASLGAAWDHTRAYLESMGNSLACYVHFNTSDTAGASGVDGWVDGPQQYLKFGGLVRSLNFGTTGGGGTGIAYRAYAGNTANNALPTLTIPSTAQVDDVAYVVHDCTASITVGNPTQSGWTAVANGTSNNAKVNVWRKRLVSGDIGQPVTPTQSATSRWAMQAIIYDGVHATTPEDVAPVVVTDNTTSTTHSTGAITPVTTGAMILQIAGNRGTTTASVGAWGQPTWLTLRGQVIPTGNPGASVAAADWAGATASTVYGPYTWTTDVALGNFVGISIAIRPA